MSTTYATKAGLTAMSVVLSTVAALTTALRFHVRRGHQKARLMADDWLVIPAEIILIGMTIAIIYGVDKNALGVPVPTTQNGVPVLPDQVPNAMILNNKMSFSILNVSFIQLGLTKLSLLFFYRRIFCTANTSIINVLTMVMIVITALWSIAMTFANLFECGTTFSADWDANDELAIAACVNEAQLTEAQYYSDFILDVILLIMPLPTVWKLNMLLKRRIAVIVILAIGSATVIASAIKVAIIYGAVNEVNNVFLVPDPMILNSNLIFWMTFESGIATIVISLPTLRVYWDKSPDLLRSLRSMISLQSLGSAGRTSHNIRLSDEQSHSSQTEITKINGLENGMGHEAHAMRDIPSESLGGKRGIMVQSHIRQDFDERQNSSEEK